MKLGRTFDKSRIPADEPCFLLRGQDPHAAAVITYWSNIAASDGADPAIVASARAQADAMREWQRVHGAKRRPDLPGGA